MNGIRFSRKWTGAALALVLGLGGGATGYAVARAKEAVTASHVHASLKIWPIPAKDQARSDSRRS